MKKAIANVHWLVLPGVEASKFMFIIESDWSSRHVGFMLIIESDWSLRHAGFMLFALKDGEECFLDIESRIQKFSLLTLVSWMALCGHVNEPSLSEECY